MSENQGKRLSKQTLKVLCAGILSASLFSFQQGPALGSVNPQDNLSGWHMLNGVPSVLSSKYKSHITRILNPDNGTETIQVQFQLQNIPQMEKVLKDERSQGSANYHKWLTPLDLQKDFAPSLLHRHQVEAYFKSQGFRLISQSANGLADTFVASHSQIVRALHTQLGTVEIGQKSYLTHTSPLYIPDNLPGIVSNIVGVDKIPLYQPFSVKPAPNAQFQPNTAWAYPGYGPQQLQTAYGESSFLSSGHNGAGTRIAIMTFASFDQADVSQYRQYYGLPAAQINVVPVSGGNTYSTGQDETTLDTEITGALAPGAILDVYETDTDITTLLNQVVSDDRDNVATISWGSPESANDSSTLEQSEALAEEALAEGITLFAASGDNGAYDDSYNLGVDYPADLPAFEGVGGTSLTLASGGSYQSETAWSYDYTGSGSGGGASSFFALPSYQQIAVNNPADPKVPLGESMRMVPDVSANGDPNTGDSIYYGYDGGWEPIGGTSAASPTWAGILATIESAMSTNQKLGDIHGIIYTSGSQNSTALHSVTQGYNGMYYAGTGFDLVTGWGSPNAANFLNVMQASLSVKASVTKLVTGDTEQAQATYIGKDVTSTVTWSVDNPSVATIDSTGKITATGVGTANIIGAYNNETASVAIKVVGLTSLTDTPPTLDLTIGQSQGLTLKAVYSDGTFANVQGLVKWSSQDTSVATVDGTGVVTAASTPGSTTIQTSYGGQSVSVPVMVHPATIGIAATLQSSKLLVGGAPTSLSVMATYSDGTTADVTNVCTVKSTYGDLKVIGTNVSAQYYGSGLDTLVVAYRGYTSKVNVTLVQTSLITMNPSGSLSIPKQSTQALALTASYSDKSTANITSAAQWKSSNTNVATVAADGTLTTVAPGFASITATYLGKTASLYVTVTPLLTNVTAALSSATVQISTMPVTVKVVAYYDNGTSAVITNGVQISEESTGTAYVKIQGFSLYGVIKGQDTLDITYAGHTIQLPITVVPMLNTLTMTPSGSLTMQKGTTHALHVTANYNDGSTADVTSSAIWKSSNLNVVTVAADGTLNAVAKGTAYITGTYLGRMLSLTVTVTPVLTGVDATLTSNTIQISTTPVTLKVTAHFDDGTSVVIYSGVTVTEEDTATQNVNVKGMYVYGLSKGTDTLDVQYQNQTAKLNITVVPILTSVTLAPGSLQTIQVGSTQQLAVTAKYNDGSTADVASSVVWKSSNNNVGRVDNSGLVTAVAKGTVYITGTYLGRTVSTTVSVIPVVVGIDATLSNSTVQIASSAATVKVTVQYNDGTSAVVYSGASVTEDNSSLGLVRINGLYVYGVAKGTDTLDVAYQGQTDQVMLNVVPMLTSVTLVPSSPQTIQVGSTQPLAVTAKYNDGSTVDVTSSVVWKSWNNYVITVDGNGLLTAKAPGFTTVTGTYLGRTVSLAVTVTKKITNLTAKVSNDPVVINGGAVLVTVTAHYDDSTTSTVVTKISSEDGYVRVSGNYLYGISNGTDVLDISYAGATMTLSVNVVHPLSSLTVAPVSPLSIKVADGTRQLALTATYSDTTTGDVTSKAQWRSTNINVLSIAADGTMTPLTTGIAYVYATYMGRTITIQVICS